MNLPRLENGRHFWAFYFEKKGVAIEIALSREVYNFRIKCRNGAAMSECSWALL